MVGIGRLTLSRRERAVMVEPRGTGMALFRLRAAEQVRTPQFAGTAGELDLTTGASSAEVLTQSRHPEDSHEQHCIRI